MSSKKEKFVIIDGNAIIHRAYHALPPFSASTGEQVNAVYGFASMLLKILDTLKPKYIAVSFDVAKKTFRDELFKEYKAKRVKADQELYDQIPLVYDLVKAFDIPIYTKEGFEADDVIGAIAKKVEEKWDGQIIIASGDKDLLQLIDDKISVFLLKKGISDTEIYNKETTKEKLGFDPEFLVDYKSLKGDTSDNIPGVKGIGDKGAKDLILKFGHLEDIYKNLDKLAENGVSKKTISLLEKEKEMAFLSQKLATIVTDIEGIDFNLKDCETKTTDTQKVVDLFRRFNFTSLIKRFLSGQKELPQKTNKETKTVYGKEALKAVEEIKKESEFFCQEFVKENLVGFVAGNRNENYFFDFSKMNNEEKEEFFSLFETDKNLVGHNLKNLIKVLFQNKIEAKNKLFDLMIASYLTNSGTRAHDLNSIVARELGVSLENETQTNLFGGQEQFLPKGSEYFFELFDLYHPLLKEQKNDELFHKIEMPLIFTLAKMELHGIKIDSTKLKNFSKELSKKIEDLSQKIWKLAGKEFNIASSVQLRDILFIDLGLPTFGIKKGKTGYSTASPELTKLKDAHEIIPLIEDYREITKLLNTYVDVLPNLADKNDRIHTTYNQDITSTGRLSSSDPNLQNIPTRTELGKKIREAFVADKNCVLVSADYSQVELRVVASLAGDKKMIEIFEQNKDIHTATAAAINNVLENEVTKAMRRAAKEVNFGVLYGMGSYGLASRTGISEPEAREFIDKYFSEFSGVKKYVDETLAFARKNGYVETFFGRRRYIPELKASNFSVRNAGERMAVNMPVQGTAADIMKIGMIKADEFIEKEYEGKAKILLQVHDELIFEVEKSEAEKFAGEIKKIMENVGGFEDGKKLIVPIVAEVSIGENWGELK